MPEIYAELATIRERLETHYRDMQDVEFTIQRKKLWMLQTRTGKRTMAAALKIAVDMTKENLITHEEAVRRIEPAALDQLLHPTLDPDAKQEVLATGLPASPGAACGAIVFTAAEAERAAVSHLARNIGKMPKQAAISPLIMDPPDRPPMKVSEKIRMAQSSTGPISRA